MTWFKTIDHKGQEVEISNLEDMNAVVDAFEERLDRLALLLDSSDRDMRVRAVSDYRAMMARRDRIEADAIKAEARANIDNEDAYHRALAEAIRTRSKS